MTVLNKLAWSDPFLLSTYRRDLTRRGAERDSLRGLQAQYLSSFLQTWTISDHPFPERAFLALVRNLEIISKV